MPHVERPQLRPYLRGARPAHDPQAVYLMDRLGLAPAHERLSPDEFALLDYFDGKHTLSDIHARATLDIGSDRFTLERLGRLVARLEERLYLDSSRFRSIVDGEVRPPRCIGCYEGEPRALREQVRGLFGRGPGLPRDVEPDGRLRAALIPHIDYPRGGVSYAWGFKEVVERSDASLFVIIGTSHYSAHRFTLTRKNFETPLGVVPTDQAFIDRLVAHYGDGLFADEWLAHFPEHSIELEVVLLQWLYEQRRPIRIVPLVVGSFHDSVTAGDSPLEQDDVACMVKALCQAEADTPEPVCFIISGDLAHIGPKFNPDEELTAALLADSLARDRAIVRCAEKVDLRGYFRLIVDELDARNICGLPPTFTALQALRPSSGQLLHYDRYIDARGRESVSYASMAFYR
jgi:AmmeMemoRadiSam system protein B